MNWIDDWPLLLPGDDIWEFLEKRWKWRTPMSRAVEAMALGDVSVAMVAERTARHRMNVENALSGSDHELDLGVEVAEAVLSLLEERWRGLQPSYRSRQATEDLRGLLVSMKELQVRRGG